MKRYRTSYRPRSIRKNESKTKKRLVWSIIISILLIFVIFRWVLPFLIGELSFFNKSGGKIVTQEESKLAPPVLNIPYEATNSAAINIKGYATPNSKVKIFLDDNLVSTTDVTSDGAFVSQDINLASGTNNIYGKTVDEKNNESLPSKSIQLTFSSKKPKLDLSEPQDNKEVQGGDRKINVSGETDPNIDVTVNGSRVIVNNDGKFSTQVNLSDGDNTIHVEASNQIGSATSVERKVKYTP